MALPVSLGFTSDNVPRDKKSELEKADTEIDWSVRADFRYEDKD